MWNKDKKVSVTDKIETLIAANVTIEGDVHFSGGIQIDGKVIGNVVSDDTEGSLVRITEKAYVQGEIRGPNVIINGQVKGHVFSTQHIELAAKAIVTGNVHYNLIEMVIGAAVNGSLMHITDKKTIEKSKMDPVDKQMADLAVIAAKKATPKPDPTIGAQ